jgi:sugar lactone lactonase YvrE
LIALLWVAPPAHAVYLPVMQWDNGPPQAYDFANITSAATDSAGNVYTVDSGTSLVQKFDANGNFLAKWGSRGSADGQFESIRAIAVDGAGAVYVLDLLGPTHVQKFDSNGNFLAKWGADGSGDGQVSFPTGIAVDPSGNVYVLDTNNHRVQKFTPSGSFITKWGSSGAGNGQFRVAAGIASDGAGNIYVTESDGGSHTLASIQKFTSNGTFLARWNAYGEAIAVSGGTAVVTDSTVVKRYDAGTGALIGSFGTAGSGDGQFKRAAAVAIGSGGAIYVGEQDNYRVQKFDSSGNYLAKWGVLRGTRDGQFRLPTDVAVDGAGNVYVADYENSRVQRFTAGGAFVRKWGTPGTGDGQFQNLRGIASDAAGNIYTLEQPSYGNDPNQGVQKFDANGNFITRFANGAGPDTGHTAAPYGIAVSPANGQVYVTDSNRILRFLPDGTFVSAWGTQGSGPGQLWAAQGIGIDSTGNVYVADTNNNRVQKFTATGGFLAQWPVSQPSDVVVAGARALVASHDHSVYVSDTSGSPQGAFGGYGSGPGQLLEPEALAANSEGDVYVADTYNLRIQTFRENAGYPRAKAATPLYAPLVPAYADCLSPNRQHAGPLGFGSCSPPAQTSGFATAGTPDANGAAANMVGSVRLRVVNGDSSTAGDEADVQLAVDVTDVRNPADLADYTGELGLSVPLRVTDHLSGLAGNGPATGTDTGLTAAVGCAATPADSSIGSTCSLATTLDTLVPGIVAEGARSVWELGQVSVTDGGPDGDADTPAGNTVFAHQGVFVP